MGTWPVALAVACLLAAPLAGVAADVDAPDRHGPPSHRIVGGGWILAGHPGTLSVAVGGGVDGFDLPVEAFVGETLTTVTKDRGGIGYDLDMYFYGTQGFPLGGCATYARDEVCEVPEGAVTLEVRAFWGVDLKVLVVTLPA